MTEPLTDETFGRLEWDDTLNCWIGGINWPADLHTEIVVSQPDGDLAASLRRARDGLDWLQQHEEQTRFAVAVQMAGVYNEAWRGEDEPITATEFARCTELVRIRFEGDGTLLLSYDGHEMFGGHVVDATFTTDRTLSKTCLVG